jgi:DNA-binding NarL/FixJ family response regulator
LGVHVKVIRRSDHAHQLLAARPVSHRSTFFFYEKNSGMALFHVQAGPDGRLPVDQAAGLLAMHCLVRGQAPSDYAVLVQVENEILENLMEKADKLLEAGRSVHGQVRLTRREEEVLAGVSNSLSNKEIASNLNLSERTVKFHVSSLLAKFQVRGRMELVREVSRHTVGITPGPMPMAREAHSYGPPPVKNYNAVPPRAVAVVPLTKRQLMA